MALISNPAHFSAPAGTLRARLLLSGWWDFSRWNYYNSGQLQHLFKHGPKCECSLNRYVTFQLNSLAGEAAPGSPVEVVVVPGSPR